MSSHCALADFKGSIPQSSYNRRHICWNTCVLSLPQCWFPSHRAPKKLSCNIESGGRGDREDQGVTLQLKLKFETFRQVFQLNVSTIAIVVTFVGTLVSFPSPNVDFLLTEPPKNYHATLNPGEGGTGRTKESRSS